MNILGVNAFRRIGNAAALVGDTEAVSTQTQRASALTMAINARLIGTDGYYVDGLRTNGEQSAHTSQLANVCALAYGVAPEGQMGRIAEYVASLDISVEPDRGMELLRALHVGGRDGDVVRILTDPSFPGWAAILKFGGTFTWETWTPSDLIGDSMSHGWGSSALVAIQEALLGVQPLAPPSGGPHSMVAVTPPSGGLTHASGTFPTPAGEFSVAWRRSPHGTRLLISVPPNGGARCQFPGKTIANVTEGGQSIGQAPGVSVVDTASATVVLAVGAGRYDFEVAES